MGLGEGAAEDKTERHRGRKLEVLPRTEVACEGGAETVPQIWGSGKWDTSVGWDYIQFGSRVREGLWVELRLPPWLLVSYLKIKP